MRSDLETLEEELAKAIGALAIQFGRLEHSVSELVTAAFGRTDIPSLQAINSVVSFRQKLDLVAALAPARIADQEELQEVQQCVRTLARFEERRNSLLHAFWAFEPSASEPGTRSLFQKRTRAHRVKGIVPSSHPADPRAIQGLANEIAEFRRLFGGRGSLYHAADMIYKSSKGRGER